MPNARLDLHMHSRMSDGALAPAELVQKAHEAGLAMMSLTDHDSTAGVEEAVQEGKLLGIKVIPGVEFDTEFRCELHILGLGINIYDEALRAHLEQLAVNRGRKNMLMLERLRGAGVDIYKYVKAPLDHITRLNIALAICDAGYARTIQDAFDNYLVKGRVGFIYYRRTRPAQAIRIIREAGGIAVLAHPTKLRVDPIPVIRDLACAGLGGIEAFYPGTTQQQLELFLSLAREKGLMLTCGSDYHGDNRPGIELGCAWQTRAELEHTYKELLRI